MFAFESPQPTRNFSITNNPDQAIVKFGLLEMEKYPRCMAALAVNKEIGLKRDGYSWKNWIGEFVPKYIELKKM